MKKFKIYILVLVILCGLIGSTPVSARLWGSSDKDNDEKSYSVDMADVENGNYSFEEKKDDDYVFPLDKNFNPFQNYKNLQKNQVGDLQQAEIQKGKQEQINMEAFSSDLELSSDNVDFYTETSQYIGKGNAKLLILKENMEMNANEIIVDQRNYEITGIGNVRILKGGAEYFGDYIRINTKKESSFFDNPILYYPEITISANTANMYTDEMTAKKGSATFKKKAAMLISTTRSGLLIPGKFFNPKREFDPDKDRYKIVAKKIFVKRSQDNTDITMKNATIYRGKYKVAYSPVFSLTTNKDTDYVETILPEFGNRSRIGTFVAPSIVMGLPNASTLKVGPLVSMDTDRRIGFGGFARLSTPKSKSEFMYSTATGRFLVDGSYDITNNLRFNFVGNEHIDSGWMIGQMPNYGGELLFQKSIAIPQGNIALSNRLSMGLFQDNKDYRKGKALTTMRYKWQTQAYNMKPLLNWEKYLMLGYSYEHDLSLYQTGDLTGVVRVGPRLYTDLGRLFAEVTYYVAGNTGTSPFIFDRYRYGQNSIRFRGQYYICKYLSIGYYATANIREKDYEGNWLTENQFIAAVGTDDLKVRIGFDTIRNSAVVGLDMLLGTNKTVAEFDEMKIKDFDSDVKESRHVTNRHKKGFFERFKKQDNNENKQQEGIPDNTENDTEDVNTNNV